MRTKLLLLACVVAGVSAPRAAGGQTAVCRDSTYSYSPHRSEACTRHGGVARWISASADRASARTARPQEGKTPRSSAATGHRAARVTARHTRRTTTRHTRRTAARSSAASRGYYTGPRGGCYTYSASGRKRYVDHSYCQ